MKIPVYHVYPLGDLIEHELEGTECICGPCTVAVLHANLIIEVQVIHHSLDGREQKNDEGPGESLRGPRA